MLILIIWIRYEFMLLQFYIYFCYAEKYVSQDSNIHVVCIFVGKPISLANLTAYRGRE